MTCNYSEKYMDGVYNELVFMSKGAIRSIRKSLKENKKVILTNHAKERLNRDCTLKHLGRPVSKDDVKLSKLKRDNRIVEYYTRDNKIYKYTLRVGISDKLDLCVVIEPTESANKIVTLWCDDKNDNHYSTDRSKFVTRKQHFTINKYKLKNKADKNIK